MFSPLFSLTTSFLSFGVFHYFEVLSFGCWFYSPAPLPVLIIQSINLQSSALFWF